MGTSDTSNNGHRRPEKLLRIGSVSASVVVRVITRDNGTRTLRSVKLQKRYAEGKKIRNPTHSPSLNSPQAQRALDLATRWIEYPEAELDFS